jgi:hypothetical protein
VNSDLKHLKEPNEIIELLNYKFLGSDCDSISAGKCLFRRHACRQQVAKCSSTASNRII